MARAAICRLHEDRRTPLRAVLALVVFCAACGGIERLDPRIGDPVRVPTSEAWEKVPRILVRTDRVELIASSLTFPVDVSARDELRRLLFTLPPSAWPYGRTALIDTFSGSGPVSAARTDANLQWVVGVLRDLDVRAVIVE
jgi:hypothetical protein